MRAHGLAAVLVVSLATPAAAEESIAAFLTLAASETPDSELRSRLVAGGTPLVEGERVLFVAEGDPASPPRIVGDFNDWGDAAPERSAMRRLGERRFFILEARLRPDARIEYLVASGDEERTDPFNARTVPAFAGRHSELRMPAWRPHPQAAPAGPMRGRLESFEHGSAAFGDRRTVFVYLPPGYDGTPRRFPSAWIGDGALYAEELGVAGQIDALIVADRIEPLVAIFVPPVVRRIEYDREPRFRELIVGELLPRIETRYRIERRRERRAILGASRGAQAALDVALAHPELFGKVGLIAPAVGPAPLAGLFDRRPPRPPRLPIHGRFAIVRSLYDDSWGPDSAALRAELERRGGEVIYREIPEGHSRETWRQRFLELFELLGAP